MGKGAITTLALLAFLGLSASAEAGLITTSVDSFAVATMGNFSSNQNVQIGGNLAAGGSAWLGRDNLIGGHIYVGSGFGADSGTQINRNVWANGDIWLGRGVSAAGLSGAGVGLDQNVNVSGDVNYRDSFWAHNRAAVAGVVGTDYQSWTGVELARPTLSTSSSQSLYYGRNASQTLTPGDYGQLSVDRDSTLYLSAGTYNFESIWLARNVNVVADTSAGVVTINVTGGFSLDRDVSLERGGAGGLLVRSGGDISIGREGNINATLFSYGRMNVESDTQIAGRLLAGNDLWLGQGVQVGGATLAESVPEPATLALFSIGTLVILRRRHYTPRKRENARPNL